MTIAFDIDGTWDRDPDLFYDVATMFSTRGHEVIIVTGRDQPLNKLLRLLLRGNHPSAAEWPILVSGPILKEQAALKAGYKVDVWCDDMPGMIQECKILGGDL